MVAGRSGYTRRWGAVLVGALVIGGSVHLPQRAASDDFVERRTGGSYARETGPFRTPHRLRPRVDFWKDVFSRYGKYDLVVHHRMFPQAMFHVERFGYITASMSPGEQERFLAYQEQALKRDVAQSLRYLGRGGRPYSSFDRQVERAMQMVPGGSEKYEAAIGEDLIRVQRGIRERYQEALERSGRYLPYIEEIFRREGAPIELTRLPFIESSFDYEATSSVGAAGIWQFMKGTARSYMTVSSLIDERRDPFVSSRAAARYLRRAYEVLGAWPLAVASYNHGVAGVAKKVAQMGTRDIAEIVEHPYLRPFGFASTNFYPELLAALEVFEERHLLFPDLREEPPLAFRSVEVPVSQPGSVIARRLGVPVSQLASLNLSLSSAVWSGRASVPQGYRLLVPTDSSKAAIELVSYDPPEREEVRMPSARPQKKTSIATSRTMHLVRTGESLSMIAARYRTTVARLCSVNQCRKNKAVVKGERIRIP